MTDWTKSSWRDKPRIQMPDYPDQDALRAVEAELSRYPLLVFAGEARRLKKHLAAAGRGEAFLLQGGDCAESFEQFSSDMIRDTFKGMLQMAIVLTHGAKVPVIKLRVGPSRPAGLNSPISVRTTIRTPVSVLGTAAVIGARQIITWVAASQAVGAIWASNRLRPIPKPRRLSASQVVSTHCSPKPGHVLAAAVANR